MSTKISLETLLHLRKEFENVTDGADLLNRLATSFTLTLFTDTIYEGQGGAFNHFHDPIDPDKYNTIQLTLIHLLVPEELSDDLASLLDDNFND